MVFNSTAFLFFFPVVVFLYFLLPGRYRWILLLISSYFFYMYWKAVYILLIVLSTLVDYFAGLKMAAISEKKKRRPYLALSILSNLGILFTFKYFNFFAESVNAMLEFFRVAYVMPAVHLLLPIGISFYTFQTMSYSIDVYKGKIKAEKSLGIFALYVTYFPQLVAGPIERSSNLIPQLRGDYPFDYKRVTDGMKLMAWGFFKKVVIADQIAPMVDYLWSDPENFGGFSIVFACYLFAYQVYCDFSGYSDIAIGASKILGIDLMTNFRRPYLAQSLSELWSRWHLSLTTWFRDYLFLPLVRNKNIKWPWQYNVAVIYVLSGVWHGADWTFILWGVITSIIIIASRMMPKTKAFIHRLSGLQRFPRLDRIVQIIITFNIFSILGIYFRSDNLGVSNTLWSRLFTSWIADVQEIITNSESLRGHILYLGYDLIQFSSTIFMIILLEVIQVREERKGDIIDQLNARSTFFRWTVYLSISVLIVLYSFDRSVPFIYFQF
ncbi:MAG: MBOAT family O-acyltransferase [Vicingaceae bacterium]